MNPARKHNPELAGESILPVWNPDRMCPFDIEAEKYVLGLMIQKPETIAVIRSVLDVGDLWEDTHQRLYSAILEQTDAELVADAVTLRQAMVERGMQPEQYVDLITDAVEVNPHFFGLGFIPDAKNAQIQAMRIHELGVRRRLIEHHQEQLKLLASDKIGLDDLVDHAKEGHAKIEISARESDALITVESTWPAPMGDAAWRGRLGDMIHAIAPHTEADPIAILVQFLIAFGNLLGRKPHWKIGATRHCLNLFGCIVGNSAKARKGTSWDFCLFLLDAIDPEWKKNRIQDGLQTGQGLIGAVKDPQFQGKNMIDVGVDDKRILMVEEEFASILAPMGSSTNPNGKLMSAIIRKFWSGGDASLTKLHNPIKTTGAHVSLIGHITFDEVKRSLSAADALNGFANRFLWVCVKRSRMLPRGGKFHELNLSPYVNYLKEVKLFVDDNLNDADTYWLDPEAQEMWDSIYAEISEPPPGAIGHMLARAEPITLRLACLYAVLDRQYSIGKEHLEAALAVWRYCHQSVLHIFGQSTQSRRGEKILTTIRAAKDGFTRTELIREVFGNQVKRRDLDDILSSLLQENRIRQVKEDRNSRSVVVYRITT